MGPELAEVVIATPTDGWRIDLPKTTPVWVSASEGVTRLLNPRTPAANDRREHYLTIQEQLVSEKTDARYCVYDAAHGDYVYTDAWIEKLTGDLADPIRFQSITGQAARSK
jgi:hypothetical protein